VGWLLAPGLQGSLIIYEPALNPDSSRISHRITIILKAAHAI